MPRAGGWYLLSPYTLYNEFSQFSFLKTIISRDKEFKIVLSNYGFENISQKNRSYLA